MKIIKRGHLETCESFSLDFSREPNDRGLRHGGFGFPCDENGDLMWDEMGPGNLRSLNNCICADSTYHYQGIRRTRWTYKVPTIGQCEDCGAEVPLDQFTNPCDCGADYNFAGQRLAPREQWGEETGEAWYDCY